jgi:hypothetical protein
MNLKDELTRVRRWLEELENFDKRYVTHPGGWEQGVFDVTAEEVILLEAIRMEQNLYEKAKERASNRLAGNVFLDAASAFQKGLTLGLAPNFNEVNLFEKIQSETNYGFSFVCGLLAALEAKKGKHYAASWMRRGEAGALANMQRKFDRLEVLTGQQSREGETLSEQLGDLAVYAIKWTVLRNEISPEEFRKWVDEIAKL